MRDATSMTSAPLLRTILRNAAKRPDAPALIFRHGRTSYGTLRDMALAAARRLHTLGLPDRRPVGIMAQKSPKAVALILGCLMVRQRFLLPSIDLGEPTLRALFDKADCAHVLGTGHRKRRPCGLLESNRGVRPRATP